MIEPQVVKVELQSEGSNSEGSFTYIGLTLVSPQTWNTLLGARRQAHEDRLAALNQLGAEFAQRNELWQKVPDLERQLAAAKEQVADATRRRGQAEGERAKHLKAGAMDKAAKASGALSAAADALGLWVDRVALLEGELRSARERAEEAWLQRQIDFQREWQTARAQRKQALELELGALLLETLPELLSLSDG